MNVVIIEDEPLIATLLQAHLKELDPKINVQKILPSIASAMAYFEHNPLPELFFSDVELEDGRSFEIFDQIASRTPVIFCTAYDEFALAAFKAHGIDYLLKPFNKRELQLALDKFRDLKGVGSTEFDATKVKAHFETQRIGRLLVEKGDQIIPVSIDSIALILKEESGNKVVLKDGTAYQLNHTLDHLSEKLGDSFYRVNRQCILSKQSIDRVTHYFSRKLLVHTTISSVEAQVVSKAKSTHFLKWLEV